MSDIYTIGYSCFKLNDFLQILQGYGINSLIDVRSNPKSKHYEEFDRNNLEPVLKSNGIIYRNYMKEFGARQEDIQYHPNGYLDFEKYTKSTSFQDGIAKIVAGINKKYTFVLMCAEKDPSMCHRNIMVAREFYKRGYTIKNILSDGSYEMQDSIENRLLDQYFPNRDQFTIFDETISFDEMVRKCYQYKNSEIGYRLSEKNEGDTRFYG